MTSESRDRQREAALWFAKLNQKRVTTDDVRSFSAWRRTPENAAAYERLQTLWDAAGSVAGTPAVQAMRDSARGRATPARRAQARVRRAFVPLAATALAAAVAVALWNLSPLWPGTHVTGVGERETIRLADGSQLHLNTDSQARVRMSGMERRVELVSGQALFEVAHDPARPFIVMAGDTSVRALGTRFDVRRRGAGATVVLVEGRVEVRAPSRPKPWVLEPDRAITTTAARPAVVPVDAGAATGWTLGRLDLRGVTLGAAITEVNRYSRAKVVLDAPGLAGERISGVFDAGDTGSFVAAVTDVYPLRAEKGPDGAVVLRPLKN